MHTVKKGYRFFRPQSGCHLPNFPWPGIIKYFPARESLVSDIPAGDGKTANLFLQCIITEHMSRSIEKQNNLSAAEIIICIEEEQCEKKKTILALTSSFLGNHTCRNSLTFPCTAEVYCNTFLCCRSPDTRWRILLTKRRRLLTPHLSMLGVSLPYAETTSSGNRPVLWPDAFKAVQFILDKFFNVSKSQNPTSIF